MMVPKPSFSVITCIQALLRDTVIVHLMLLRSPTKKEWGIGYNIGPNDKRNFK